MKDAARKMADIVVAAVTETKAFDAALLKVDHISSIADYFFICSGASSRQVKAIAEHIRARMKQDGGYLPLGSEGEAQGHWILLDYGDIIVHIFYQPVREFYDLDGLWMDAEVVDLKNPSNNPTGLARSMRS